MSQRAGFPARGASWASLRQEMIAAKAGDVDWRHGRSPAYIHFAGDDVLDVCKAAYDLYFPRTASVNGPFPVSHASSAS